MTSFICNGNPVDIDVDGISLLEALREHLGLTSVKDGCSPQGQCGCCTVLIDGQARVSCVTPLRRVHGRTVTTAEGIDEPLRTALVSWFDATAASQCGFCTPGILCRIAGAHEKVGALDDAGIKGALSAHLCRCTGWQPIVEAATGALSGDPPPPPRDRNCAARRALLEGGVPQDSGAHVPLGGGGFADDTAPSRTRVALATSDGGFIGAQTPETARLTAGKVQGRNSTVALTWPMRAPDPDAALSLVTTWVEPAYLEPDASWAAPAGEPKSPLGNGGAFGAKATSEVTRVAQQLSAAGSPIRVLYPREEVVRRGPKRPPMAISLGTPSTVVVPDTLDGDTLTELATTARHLLGDTVIETTTVVGPAVSAALRGALWVELAAFGAVRGSLDVRGSIGVPLEVCDPAGGRATATIEQDGSISITVDAGDPLCHATLSSYVTGAAHQALSMVLSEGIAVDDSGAILDLTIRSFGIISARAMPHVHVTIVESAHPPVSVARAVTAAVAAAVWLAEGLPERWPTRPGATLALPLWNCKDETV